MADNFKFVQNQPTTLAGAGGSIGDTSLILTSLVQIDGTTTLTMTDFGNIGYATIEPGNGIQEEQISFTGITQNSNGTATLTGVKTVLFISPYTESSGLTKTHPGGAQLVISNTAGFYNKLTSKSDDETITGTWTFTNPNYPRIDTVLPYPTDDEQFATKGYADSLAFFGAPNASTTVKGIVQEAVQSQVDARTQAGSTGAELFLNPTTQRSTLLSDYVADTGSGTNTFAILPTPAITGYTVGQNFSFKALHGATGASTLTVSGLTSKAIKKLGGSNALVTGDIIFGQIVDVEYDGTGFQMINPSAKEFMDLTTSQNVVTGTKTFTTLPQSSTVPSTGNDLINKTYADGKFAYQFFSGTASKNSNDASGSQSIAHGFSGSPKFVRITAIPNGGTSIAKAFTAYNGTTQSSISIYGTTGNLIYATSFTLNSEAAGSGNTQSGVISVTGTNIDIAWTRTGSPVGSYNLLVEAIG